VRCRGIRWSVEYGADLVRASVPSRCLGRSKWVHVGMMLLTFDGSQSQPVYLDDPLTNGYIINGYVAKWGPRVYR
jgi:hypothetical protein